MIDKNAFFICFPNKKIWTIACFSGPLCKKTRTELPSCEAIDVKRVSIGNIVLPGNKFKAGTNLGLLPT